MTPSASVFDADPSSGLPARAREERGGSCATSGPGDETAPDDRNASGPRSHPMEESGIVRAAVETDLPAMGEVHAATMLASLAAGHERVRFPAGQRRARTARGQAVGGRLAREASRS